MSLEDYNLPPAAVILIEEKNLSLPVCLPTGNDKVYSISKSKTVRDLKERIAVFLMDFFHLAFTFRRTTKFMFNEQRGNASR